MLERMRTDQEVVPSDTTRGRDHTPAPTPDRRRHWFVSWNPFRQETSPSPTREIGQPEEQDAQPTQPVDWGYYVAISLAFLGIAAVAVVTMYVSYSAQHAFTESIKGGGQAQEQANQFAAAAWDIAAIAFAVLGLATAMRGDSALRARVGNIACAAASVAMNGAQVSAPEGAEPHVLAGHLLVWLGPPLLYAATTDMIIMEIQRRSMERRGLPLEHASIWSVLSVLLRGVVGVLLWLGRLVFSPFKTISLFRQWYLAEVAYAPGRTVESDKAREALEAASAARGFAEEVERQSAAAIAEAQADYTRRANEAEQAADDAIREARAAEKTRAEESIRKERERATAGITAERERATDAITKAEARVEELEAAHALALQQLQKDHTVALQRLSEEHTRAIGALQDTVSGQRQELERLRPALEQAQASATQGAEHARALQEARGQLEREQQARTRIDQQVRSLRTETDDLFARLSGNAQVQYLYDRLGRQGDPRHGDVHYISEIAQEFLDQYGVSLTPAKVTHYLRTYVSDSGLAASGVTGGSGDSMGGTQ